MSTSHATADGDESPYRWPAFTLRRTIVFSLALHALIGGLLVLTASDKPAANEAPGTTVVSLRHEIAASSAPATRTASGGAHAAAGSDAATGSDTKAPATTAVVATAAPTAMRVTPVRAIDTAVAEMPLTTSTATPTAAPVATPSPAPAATRIANSASPTDTTAIDEARRRYLAALGPLFRKHLVYPVAAQIRGLEGQALVSLRIARDGSVQALTIRRSSGEPLLDDSALATVRRAAPLPPLPAGLPEAALDVNVPLSFGLDTRTAPND